QRFVPDNLHLAVAVVRRGASEAALQILDDAGGKRTARVVGGIVRAPVDDVDSVERRYQRRVRQIQNRDAATGPAERIPEGVAFLLRRQEVGVHVFAARNLPRIKLTVTARRQAGVERGPDRPAVQTRWIFRGSECRGLKQRVKSRQDSRFGPFADQLAVEPVEAYE